MKGVRIFFFFLILVIILPGSVFALPVIDQSGNLITNGNFESGTTSWVTTTRGYQSAFSNYLQWEGSGSVSTQLVTEPLIEGNYTGHIIGSSPNHPRMVSYLLMASISTKSGLQGLIRLVRGSMQTQDQHI